MTLRPYIWLIQKHILKADIKNAYDDIALEPYEYLHTNIFTLPNKNIKQYNIQNRRTRDIYSIEVHKDISGFKQAMKILNERFQNI